MTDALPIGILGALSVFLVWHHDYEDGIIGRIALGSIVFVAMIVMLGAWTGKFTYNLPLELSMFLWAVVAFAARHVYRFIRFTKTGENAWKTAANQGQRVVLWNTFQPLCSQYRADGKCGHSDVRGKLPCAESICPLLIEKPVQVVHRCEHGQEAA